MRVLHIVENLDRGAVENWLVRMLRHAHDRGIVLDWTFFCALGRPGRLDEEARSLGARVVHSPVPLGDTIAFLRALRAELRGGRYEVLHCHHDLVSGLYLLAAEGIPLRRRLVHVHNADEALPTPSRLKVALLRPVLRWFCLHLADGIVGISQHTLDTFLAGKRRPGRDRVHYYGIDGRPFFQTKSDRAGFRGELGLPSDAKLLLFAGRLVPEKNPLFAMEVLREMRRRDETVFGIFVGSGSLERALREAASVQGLESSVRFLGWRDDIPAVMKACDWFILPRPEHPMEGLGIAVVEAQLAGLRLLLSEGIADDPILPGSIWARLPLAAGAVRWAEEAARMGELVAVGSDETAGALARSPFDLDFALRGLVEIGR